MPIDLTRLCKCHGEPMYYSGTNRHSCHVRIRDYRAAYQQSVRYRAAKLKYRQSEKGRAKELEYAQRPEVREAAERRRRTERRREADRLYHQREDVKARRRERLKSYRKTAVARACVRRYKQGEAGRAANKRCNDKRVTLGARYFGLVKTKELAAAMNANLRRQLSEFKQRQSARKEAESVPAGAVCPEAEA